MLATSAVETFFQERKAVTPARLMEELEEYRENAEETTYRLNSYVFEHYGIPKVSETLDFWWRDLPAPAACLARQVISPSTEQLAFSIVGAALSKEHGLDWRIMPFTDDCYGRHRYKESLLKMPHLLHEPGKGCVGVKIVELIPSKEKRKELLEGNPPILHSMFVPMLQLPQASNAWDTLPSYHGRLWKLATNRAAQSSAEAGSLHSRLLYRSMDRGFDRKPGYFFQAVGKRAVKRDASEWKTISVADRLRARPPAQWYYFFYLSLFVTGKRVLFASLDDDKDVHAMFEVVEEIERATGRKPLIAAIPYKHATPRRTFYFNEYNPFFLRVEDTKPFMEHVPQGSTVYDMMLDTESFLTSWAP